MKSAAFIVVTLLNQGYWFGGQEASIRVQPSANVSVAKTVFEWQLMLGDTEIRSDRLALRAGDEPSSLKIVLPDVRVRTDLRLVYQVRRVGQEKGQKPKALLESGERAIHVYPNDLLAILPKLLETKKTIVWDTAGPLSSVLKHAHVEHERIDDISELSFQRPDVIIVGPDRLGDAAADQTRILGHARAGANVLVLCQSRTKFLAGYLCINRAAPSTVSAVEGTKLQWRTDHPLARNHDDFTSILAGTTLRALRLPADEPVLEIAKWAAEITAKRAEPSPIDTVLAVKAIGKGRIVFCQIPFESWENDPRAQLFLADAVDYMRSPIQPILRPSQRREKAQKSEPARRSDNILDSFKGENR